jgi:antitoxin component YwqK of YwqJK toxin-antitoxin module
MSMDDVENRFSLPMSEVSGKSSDGIYRYYAKGSNKPFTGVLFSKYPNGQFNSWQEYVDGVGQGLWINYYENGNYKEIGHYEQNRVEGPIQKFHPNGKLEAVGVYKDWRIRVGIWRYFDKSGKLISEEDYGQKVLAFYCPFRLLFFHNKPLIEDQLLLHSLRQN